MPLAPVCLGVLCRAESLPAFSFFCSFFFRAFSPPVRSGSAMFHVGYGTEATLGEAGHLVCVMHLNPSCPFWLCCLIPVLSSQVCRALQVCTFILAMLPGFDAVWLFSGGLFRGVPSFLALVLSASEAPSFLPCSGFPHALLRWALFLLSKLWSCESLGFAGCSLLIPLGACCVACEQCMCVCVCMCVRVFALVVVVVVLLLLLLVRGRVLVVGW